ncbi:MAG TPA: CbiX/SirB N-terminal domain-containing protein [Blastocatellia bacterium]|nr:CbiX/SirB N-terminal domain-containing protein [Blastocatellia bacterium]
MSQRRFDGIQVACLVACLSMVFSGTFSPVSVFGADRERVAVVIVGHGLPAKDFPREKLREFRRLMGQVMEAGGEEKAPAELVARLHALEHEMRRWPRTPQNDPYDAAVRELASRIKQVGGFDVVEVAHNESCGMDVGEAITSAIQKGATRIVVLTTMLIRGGTHAEVEIAQKVEQARKAHPRVKIVYAWPFDGEELTRLFVAQATRFLPAAKAEPEPHK